MLILLENEYEAYITAKFSLYFIWLPISTLLFISGILNIFELIKYKQKRIEIIILSILSFLFFIFFVYFLITI